MNQFSFSISKLISNLINQPNNQEYISLPDEEIKATTIRLDPAVRKFCDDQSAKLGISVQAFIAMVLNGVMLESVHPVKATLQLIYERFFEVFKEHNIAIADIPAVLNKFNLSLSMLADNDKLIDALDDELISFISQQFVVNPAWLKGASDYVRINKIRWYKNIYSFCSHLISLKKDGLNPHLMFIKSDKTDLSITDDSSKAESEIIPVIRLEKEYLSGKYFYYYQVCEGGYWSYWRARYQLKSIILFCQFLNISFGGYTIKFNNLVQLNQDQQFVNQIINKPACSGYTWYPEDYIYSYSEGNLHIRKGKEDFIGVYLEFTESSLDKLFFTEKKLTSHPYLDRMKEKYDSRMNNIGSAASDVA